MMFDSQKSTCKLSIAIACSYQADPSEISTAMSELLQPERPRWWDTPAIVPFVKSHCLGKRGLGCGALSSAYG